MHAQHLKTCLITFNLILSRCNTDVWPGHSLWHHAPGPHNSLCRSRTDSRSRNSRSPTSAGDHAGPSSDHRSFRRCVRGRRNWCDAASDRRCDEKQNRGRGAEKNGRVHDDKSRGTHVDLRQQRTVHGDAEIVQEIRGNMENVFWRVFFIACERSFLTHGCCVAHYNCVNFFCVDQAAISAMHAVLKPVMKTGYVHATLLLSPFPIVSLY